MLLNQMNKSQVVPHLELGVFLHYLIIILHLHAFALGLHEDKLASASSNHPGILKANTKAY